MMVRATRKIKSSERMDYFSMVVREGLPEEVMPELRAT